MDTNLGTWDNVFGGDDDNSIYSISTILSTTILISGRHIPEPFTPPYVSHIPDITHINLDRNDR